MLFVVDTEAARVALHARVLTCPEDGCGGRLQPWSTARARTVTVRVGEQVRLTPDRGRCGRCRVSQTLLPAWYVPRRSCGIEVIGAAIQAHVNHGHGHGRVADGLGLGQATVRGWLRGVKDAADKVYAIVRQVTICGIAHVHLPDQPIRPLCVASTAEVARALAELAFAAKGFIRPDPPNRTRSATGIDYLHILGQQARRDVNHLLRLADPTDARPTMGLWPAINIVSGGRLLTLIASRAAVT